MTNEIQVSETKIINGPNFWSVDHHKLIVMKIKAPEVSAGDIQQLIKKLASVFPRLSTEVSDNAITETASFIKEIALGLQAQAGMPCTFSASKSAGERTDYFIAYQYSVEQAGIYAGIAAINLIQAILKNAPYSIDEEVLLLKKIKKKYGAGATSAYILEEVKKRNIPLRKMNAGSLVTLGYGIYQKKLRTAVAETTSGLGIELAGDKEETKNILAQANIPVPQGIIVYSEAELRSRIGEVKYPLVVKPLNGNQGRGVTTHIEEINRAIFGFNIAKRISDEVIVEEFIPGEDHRFLVINYKLVAVARRSPAMVTGNGINTIQQLIDEVNKDPQRGDSEEHVLAQIKVDEVTKKILSENKLTLETILPAGKTLVLKDTANISAGGTATDLTDLVHPENKFLAERIARLFSLDICGVDIMTTSVEHPITRETGAVIEVNAGPGIRMHSNPQDGQARNVAAPIVDMLFPPGSETTIPIVAVANSYLGALPVNLLMYFANYSGAKAGCNTQEGIIIDGHKVKTGNATDYKSMQDVLFDPSVDLAILECTDEEIIRNGLGFRKCDISIIPAISTVPPLNSEISGTQDLFALKSVLAKTTKAGGYCILNADDKKVLRLQKEVESEIALYSLQSENAVIREHKEKGKFAAVLENSMLVIYKGDWRIEICSLSALHIKQDKHEELISALLSAVLAAMLLNIKVEVLKTSMVHFFKEKLVKDLI